MFKKLIWVSLLFVCNSAFSQKQLTYTNPVLAGFYPDPSIVQAPGGYYMVTSTFAYFPGLPIFHSTDLVNWQQLGHAMDRNEQLDLKGAGVSRGLFAPAITFHKNKFYITCTLIDKGGNFIISATDPRGPWSNPVWLPKVKGIDPSLFFDQDNKLYIVYNSEPPGNNSLYDGHRTIRMWQLDTATFKTIGDEKLLVNGGVDITKKPVWIEAPHIFIKDNWYYLICAEGGTAYNHSEVVFRSSTVNGPYVPFEKNPILTQRHLDRNRPNPVTTTGHADLVQAPDSSWWAVFLGCRPYEKGYFNTGRETFLTPVQWQDGWPIINPSYETIQYSYPVPAPAITSKVNNQFSGNFSFRDDFKDNNLNHRFIFLRNPTDHLYNLEREALKLPLKQEQISGKENPAFIGFRQSHQKGYAATEINFEPLNENEKAGLIIFQNEQHYYFLAKAVKNGKAVVELYQSAKNAGQPDSLLAIANLKKMNNSLKLKIEANGDSYAFYFAEKNKPYRLLKQDVDARFLSTEVAGGFVGSVFGMYATSLGKPSDKTAVYKWFHYQGDDAVFK